MDPESHRPKARDLALRRLTVREYSSVEMQGYLRRKGVPAEEARTVVRELEERGLIDPDRYAAAIARSQIARGKGPMAVLAKLKRRGIQADLGAARRIYEVEAGGSGLSELEVIRRVLSSRFPGLDPSDRKVVARVYRSLMRRGFSAQAICSALDTTSGSG
jgi:SOS response regulatory protein OraA/RecX